MTTRLDETRSLHREAALRHGIPPRDVDLFLGDLLGKPLSWLLAHGDQPLDPAPLEALLARRYAGEPLQYIRNRTEFFGRDFYLDGRVLIPRPETEILVETAIARAPRGCRLADLGTGSGCVAIAIAKERPDLRVTALDVSVAALAVARRNRDQLAAPVTLVASNLLAATRRPFEALVSNPPYIAEEELATLAPEVRDHEPRVALTPGPTGFETIERIFGQAGTALVIIEIGFGQLAQVRNITAAHHFRIDAVVDDLAGIPRVVVSSPA